MFKSNSVVPDDVNNIKTDNILDNNDQATIYNMDAKVVPIMDANVIPNVIPNVMSNVVPNTDTKAKAISPDKKSTLENSRPTTLTILIQTRIANRQNINFYPSMIAPKTNAKKVLFNPLVELHKNIVVDIPPNSTPEYLYTQFFDSDSFSTLLNRTLNSYDQPKDRTLQEATDAGIIGKNIDIILTTLFKSNNKFYIDKKPYTVFGYEWVNREWSIDVNFETKNQIYRNPISKKNTENELKKLFNETVRKSSKDVNVANEAYKYQNEQHVAIDTMGIAVGVPTKTEEPIIPPLNNTKETNIIKDEMVQPPADVTTVKPPSGEVQDKPIKLDNIIKPKTRIEQEELDLQKKREKREIYIEAVEKSKGDVIQKTPLSFSAKVIHKLVPFRDLLEQLENNVDNNTDYDEKRVVVYTYEAEEIAPENFVKKIEELFKQHGSDIENALIKLVNDLGYKSITEFAEQILEFVKNISTSDDKELYTDLYKQIIIHLNRLIFHYYEMSEIKKLYNEIETTINENNNKLTTETSQSELNVDINECIILINFSVKLYYLLCVQLENMVKSFFNFCDTLKQLIGVIIADDFRTIIDNAEQNIAKTIRELNDTSKTINCPNISETSLSHKCSELIKYQNSSIDINYFDLNDFIKSIVPIESNDSPQFNNVDFDLPDEFRWLGILQKKDFCKETMKDGFCNVEENNELQEILKLDDDNFNDKINDFYEKVYKRNFPEDDAIEVNGGGYKQSGGDIFIDEFNKLMPEQQILFNRIRSKSRDYLDETDVEYQQLMDQLTEDQKKIFKKELIDRIKNKRRDNLLKQTPMLQNSMLSQYSSNVSYNQTNKWSYYVRVELNLYPGDSIPLEDYSSLVCQFRYEKIRQIWAELFGVQYAPGILDAPGFYKPKNKDEKDEKNKPEEKPAPTPVPRIA